MSPKSILVRATVSRVQSVIREVLSDRVPPGNLHPWLRVLEMDLGQNFQLPPSGEKLLAVCDRISGLLYCNTPPAEVREKWTTLRDLYIYYLGKAKMEEAIPPKAKWDRERRFNAGIDIPTD